MRFFVRIAPADRVPHGYGMCWPADNSMEYVLCPLPLNLLVRPLRIALRWAIGGGWVGPRWERTLRRAWRHGYEKGREAERVNVERERARAELTLDLCARIQARIAGAR